MNHSMNHHWRTNRIFLHWCTTEKHFFHYFFHFFSGDSTPTENGGETDTNDLCGVNIIEKTAACTSRSWWLHVVNPKKEYTDARAMGIVDRLKRCNVKTYIYFKGVPETVASIPLHHYVVHSCGNLGYHHCDCGLKGEFVGEARLKDVRNRRIIIANHLVKTSIHPIPFYMNLIAVAKLAVVSMRLFGVDCTPSIAPFDIQLQRLDLNLHQSYNDFWWVLVNSSILSTFCLFEYFFITVCLRTFIQLVHQQYKNKLGFTVVTSTMNLTLFQP